MPGVLFLEGDDINLRTVEEEDLEFLRDNINDPDIRRHLTAREPVNMEQERDFFENMVSEDGDVHLAISKNEKMIGIVSLEKNQNEIRVAEIGIWIETSQHGNGYGTEAAELITEYGFNELNYHRIMARAHADNTGSQKIWEKLGFEKEGELRGHNYKDGEFVDAYINGVLEDEWN